MCKKIFIFHLLIVICTSCNKFLDVGTPSDNIVSEAVYQSTSSAAGVLTGIYPDIYNLVSGTEFFFKCSLMADEFTLQGQFFGLDNYYNNDYGMYTDFWPKFYSLLYRINSAIEGLNGSTGLPMNIKEQLLGESYFLRAWCYFYLANIYGDVPLVVKSDYKENSTKSRSSVKDVFDRVIDDLLEAKKKLDDNYLSADVITITDDRVRPTKDVAAALLARVYLYRGNWALAKAESDSIIENRLKYDLVPLPDVFFEK